MPYSPMHKHCTPVKNLKGKTTGLMMEGSAMHMSMLHQESEKQEKKDLLKDMPVDDKASAMEMSPYKMGHEDSPTEMSPYKMGHEDSPASMGHEDSPAKMGHESPAKMGHKKKVTTIAEKSFDDELKQQGRLQGFAEIPEGGVTRAAREKTNKFKKDISAPKAKALTSNPIKFTGMSGGSALHQKLKMVKVDGKMVPEFAADGKGKNDLKKK